MKKNEVQIGGVYRAKVTDKLVSVRIDAENRHGGWDATNLETNRKIRIKSAQRLQSEATPAQLRAIAAADQENARLRDERETSEDGMTDSERAMSNSAAKRKGRTAKKAASSPTDAESGAEATPKPNRSKAATRAKGADDGGKKISCLDAAAQVLAASGEPMNAKQMIDAITEKGLWTSPGGKTPHATLYSAIIREISTKGDESRFRKTERGKFAAA